MGIRLLFFAALRDATGQRELEVRLPSEVNTVAGLRQWISAEFASLAARLPSVRVAVNEAFVEDEHVLEDGDVVALIPPVTGG